MKTKVKADQVYVFVGDGEGVPGLPHQVTVSEAEALGVADLLKAAIANGNYALSPQMRLTPNLEGDKEKESEVDDGR